jgi:hypothetical protein
VAGGNRQHHADFPGTVIDPSSADGQSAVVVSPMAVRAGAAPVRQGRVPSPLPIDTDEVS